MFNPRNCWYCGKKEDKHGKGCNNPDCKEYYKLKGVKNTEQPLQPNLQTNKGENDATKTFF